MPIKSLKAEIPFQLVGSKDDAAMVNRKRESSKNRSLLSMIDFIAVVECNYVVLYLSANVRYLYLN